MSKKKVDIMEYQIIRLIDRPEMKEQMANWFSEKWSVPLQAYLDSMEDCLSKTKPIPQWYIAVDDSRIIGGLGVIENDFHNRKDLTPNVCAVYTEPDRRSQGIAGALLRYVCEDMKAKGVNVTRAVCNSSVAKYFRNNTAIKNAIYVFANGTVNVTTAKALEYILAETGINLVVYDEVYVNEAGAVVKYVPDDTLVLMPEGDLGNTHMGVTPEESDLMNSLNAKVSIVDNGIAVTTHEEHDPVNVETKVTMVALPSFERANEIVIADVIA